MRSTPRWLALATMAGLALALSACGSSGSSSSTSATSNTASAEALKKYPAVTSAPSDATCGGELTVLNAGDVDHIDPGAGYYQTTYQVLNPVQRQLLSWAPADVDTPTPDLATAQPDVSDDFKTVTFHIYPDVMYSPPVDRAVKTADIKYAIERALLPGVANSYIGVYLAAVDGFKDALAAVKQDPTVAPDISGIETPDDTTIVFHLNEPTASSLVQSMTLPYSAPVPEEYAAKYDAENPSGYGENQVATGPYMIDEYSPGKEIKLVRNPNWDDGSGDSCPANQTDFRPGYLDSVDIQEGYSDTASAARKVLSGTDVVNGDFPPPPTVLKETVQQHPDQLQILSQGGIRYVALNTQKPPFDDINVRKAVIANSDRTSLVATRGGPLIGPVATHYIVPNIPGFEQSGGYAGPTGSEYDFVQNPEGDPQLAAEYMKKAGYSSGKCEGSNCDVSMVADNSPPGSDTAQIVKDSMEELGFHVDLQPVTHDVMYTKFCNVPANQPDVCPNVAWGKDFSDAQSLLDPTFNGEAIASSNNSNWPLLDVPAINKAIDAARLINDPQERADAWAKVDDMIGAQAPAIPWIWDNFPLIESTDVNGVSNLFNAAWDFGFTSLQNP